MLCTLRRRLYLMRHAEVSYVGERDPEVVRLTERGLEQAAAAHRALEDVSFDLVVTSSLPRTVETASVHFGIRCGQRVANRQPCSGRSESLGALPSSDGPCETSPSSVSTERRSAWV